MSNQSVNISIGTGGSTSQPLPGQQGGGSSSRVASFGSIGKAFYRQTTKLIKAPFYFLLPSVGELKKADKGGLFGLIWLIVRYVLKFTFSAMVIYLIAMFVTSLMEKKGYNPIQDIKDAVARADPNYDQKVRESGGMYVDPITKELKNPLITSMLMFALFVMFLSLFAKTKSVIFGFFSLASLGGIFYLATIFGGKTGPGTMSYVLACIACLMMILVLGMILKDMFKRNPFVNAFMAAMGQDGGSGGGKIRNIQKLRARMDKAKEIYESYPKKTKAKKKLKKLYDAAKKAENLLKKASEDKNVKFLHEPDQQNMLNDITRSAEGFQVPENILNYASSLHYSTKQIQHLRNLEQKGDNYEINDLVKYVQDVEKYIPTTEGRRILVQEAVRSEGYRKFNRYVIYFCQILSILVMLEHLYSTFGYNSDLPGVFDPAKRVTMPDLGFNDNTTVFGEPISGNRTGPGLGGNEGGPPPGGPESRALVVYDDGKSDVQGWVREHSPISEMVGDLDERQNVVTEGIVVVKDYFAQEREEDIGKLLEHYVNQAYDQTSEYLENGDLPELPTEEEEEEMFYEASEEEGYFGDNLSKAANVMAAGVLSLVSAFAGAGFRQSQNAGMIVPMSK